jgi:hypothetical protein
MRETTGPKLDNKTLEALRLRAVDAAESRVHSENAAASLGWRAARRTGGWPTRYGQPPPHLGPGGGQECARHGDPHRPSRERDTAPRSPRPRRAPAAAPAAPRHSSGSP